MFLLGVYNYIYISILLVYVVLFLVDGSCLSVCAVVSVCGELSQCSLTEAKTCSEKHL
jgi:hypothetical protein